MNDARKTFFNLFVTSLEVKHMISKAVWIQISCIGRLGVRASVCRSINMSTSAEGLLLHAIIFALTPTEGARDRTANMERGSRPLRIDPDGHVPVSSSEPGTICSPCFPLHSNSSRERQQVDWETVGGHLACLIPLRPTSTRHPRLINDLATASCQN